VVCARQRAAGGCVLSLHAVPRPNLRRFLSVPPRLLRYVPHRPRRGRLPHSHAAGAGGGRFDWWDILRFSRPAAKLRMLPLPFALRLRACPTPCHLPSACRPAIPRYARSSSSFRTNYATSGAVLPSAWACGTSWRSWRGLVRRSNITLAPALRTRAAATRRASAVAATPNGLPPRTTYLLPAVAGCRTPLHCTGRTATPYLYPATFTCAVFHAASLLRFVAIFPPLAASAHAPVRACHCGWRSSAAVCAVPRRHGAPCRWARHYPLLARRDSHRLCRHRAAVTRWRRTRLPARTLRAAARRCFAQRAGTTRSG